MKIKKLILKITLFLCIWIFGLSLAGMLIKSNSGYKISNTKSDFYKSDYIKDNYLYDKLKTLVDYYNDKNYIDEYDTSKVNFSVLNLGDNSTENFSIDSIKQNHKSSYNDVFGSNFYYASEYDNINKKFKDTNYLAVPKKNFFDIMNKYTEKIVERYQRMRKQQIKDITI